MQHSTPSSSTTQISDADRLKECLIFSLKNPHAYDLSKSFLDTLATNNPRGPATNSRAPSIDGGAQRWHTASGDVAKIVFPAKLDLRGHFSKVGPYFNSARQDGSVPNEHFNEHSVKKMRAQFEFRPLTADDDEASSYPPNAVQVSQQAIGSALRLTALLQNNRKPADDWSITNFLRAYEDNRGGRFAFVVVSPFLTTANEKQQVYDVSLEDLEDANATFSPSKQRSPSKAASSARGSDGAIPLSEMSDPSGLYANVKGHENIFINPPNVYDSSGAIIHPNEYESLQDGTIVMVEASFAMWDIAKASRRICHMRLESIQVLPLDHIPPSSSTLRTVTNTPKKRKAAAKATTGSPAQAKKRKSKRVQDEAMNLDGGSDSSSFM